MICSLIGAFLLVYVAVITFMNILGFPLDNFMLVQKKASLSLKTIYMIAFGLEVIAMFIILEEGHIITFPLPPIIIQFFCFLFAVGLSIVTILSGYSHCAEKRSFMAPLHAIITLCFWLTLLNI